MKVAMNIATLALVALAAALAALPAAAAEPTTSAAAARHFEGTVVSVDRSARTFRLRDSERGTVRVKVTSATRFQRIAGFGGLKRGLTNVEATVRRSGGQWVASSVEISGGGGRHGGGHGR
jgi:Cu/Ag efflux protein CusF